MFASFQMELSEDSRLLEDYNCYRLDYDEDIYRTFEKKLDEYLKLNDNDQTESSLDADKIIKDWFSEIKCHIFLSHSHRDEKQVTRLANYLWDKHRIISFIDSKVWGYCDNLLKKIDEKYCLKNTGYYDYDTRNCSTSHVHMMLMTSLLKMIDATECFLFLKTDNSLTITDSIENTKSPWIYAEIIGSSVIQTRVPERLKDNYVVVALESLTAKYEAEQKRQQLVVDYTLATEHLIAITQHDLTELPAKKEPLQALNNLYLKKSIIKNKPQTLLG